jgi:hypothetical protein
MFYASRCLARARSPNARRDEDACGFTTAGQRYPLAQGPTSIYTKEGRGPRGPFVP